jgi:hypothetical protein
MTLSVCDRLTDPAHTVALVACSSAKSSRGPARDLYQGALFKASVRWAESWGLRWMVFSALHGVVHPDEIIDPYDVTLARPGSDLSSLERAGSKPLPAGVRQIVVLGGHSYVDAASALWRRIPQWAPLQELPAGQRGYGYYRSWLAHNLGPTPSPLAAPAVPR